MNREQLEEIRKQPRIVLAAGAYLDGRTAAAVNKALDERRALLDEIDRLTAPDPHVVAVLDAAIVLGQSMPRFVEGSGPWDYSAEEVALGRAVDALLASRHTLRDTKDES